MQRLRDANPRLLLLREHPGCVDTLVLLAGEMLRRLEATARAGRAEQALLRTEAHATLGRYMIEMRHTFNNALTSGLGNSELLLLEPGTFSAAVREQISTIHTMGLRIHEILQRFNNMEVDMKCSPKSHSEMRLVNRSLAATQPSGMD
jgi:signal transduction histidine kinase